MYLSSTWLHACVKGASKTFTAIEKFLWRFRFQTDEALTPRGVACNSTTQWKQKCDQPQFLLSSPLPSVFTPHCDEPVDFSALKSNTNKNFLSVKRVTTSTTFHMCTFSRDKPQRTLQPLYAL